MSLFLTLGKCVRKPILLSLEPSSKSDVHLQSGIVTSIEYAAYCTIDVTYDLYVIYNIIPLNFAFSIAIFLNNNNISLL